MGPEKYRFIETGGRENIVISRLLCSKKSVSLKNIVISRIIAISRIVISRFYCTTSSTFVGAGGDIIGLSCPATRSIAFLFSFVQDYVINNHDFS